MRLEDLQKQAVDLAGRLHEDVRLAMVEGVVAMETADLDEAGLRAYIDEMKQHTEEAK